MRRRAGCDELAVYESLAALAVAPGATSTAHPIVKLRGITATASRQQHSAKAAVTKPAASDSSSGADPAANARGWCGKRPSPGRARTGAFGHRTDPPGAKTNGRPETRYSGPAWWATPVRASSQCAVLMGEGRSTWAADGAWRLLRAGGTARAGEPRAGNPARGQGRLAAPQVRKSSPGSGGEPSPTPAPDRPVRRGSETRDKEHRPRPAAQRKHRLRGSRRACGVTVCGSNSGEMPSLFQ